MVAHKTSIINPLPRGYRAKIESLDPTHTRIISVCGVRWIGGLTPLRWYQIAQRRIIERGAGLAEIAIPCLALTCFFGVMLLLIRWRMKPRLA